jgi:hypothetical protein
MRFTYRFELGQPEYVLSVAVNYESMDLRAFACGDSQGVANLCAKQLFVEACQLV